MNGSNYERKLARSLDEQGYHVMRAPSSGSATKRELPDLFWSCVDEHPVAAELKATSQNVAYFDDHEVNALQEFALAFGAMARLVARFKGDTTYYSVSVDNARVTDGGFAVDRDLEAIETVDP